MTTTLIPRSDWSLTPPDDSGTWEPYAYLVGGSDGWDLYWIRKDDDDPGANGPGPHIDWPFGNDDFATPENFKRLGFRVET